MENETELIQELREKLTMKLEAEKASNRSMQSTIQEKDIQIKDLDQILEERQAQLNELVEKTKNIPDESDQDKKAELKKKIEILTDQYHKLNQKLTEMKLKKQELSDQIAAKLNPNNQNAVADYLSRSLQNELEDLIKKKAPQFDIQRKEKQIQLALQIANLHA